MPANYWDKYTPPGETMKFIIFAGIFSVLAGCSKINNIATNQKINTTQSSDSVHDEQTEMRVLVPWSLVL